VFHGDETKTFQASYELAAGVVNKYYTASPSLREAFSKAVKKAGITPPKGDTVMRNRRECSRRSVQSDSESGGKHLESENTDTFYHLMFFAQLSMVTDNEYASLGE